VGVPVVVVAGISNVPSVLISGMGPDAMEKFGGTLSVVGENVLVGSAVPSVAVEVVLVVAVGASVLSDEGPCVSGEAHGTVLFPESVGAGALASGLLLSVGYEPSSVEVAFTGIESVGSGRSLELVGVGSAKGSTVE